MDELIRILSDLVLIEKVIGAGEIAISDHRSSQPTFEDIAHLAAECRVGGMLGGKAGVLLVDCLTLWISNLVMENQAPDKIIDQFQRLTRTVVTVPCPVILVSNEVGTGIVPENQLARLYRDLVGSANQAVAECVDQVVWVVAGIPVIIKG